MATLAKLLVALGLDAKEYEQGLDNAERKADGFGSKIGGFLGGAMKMGLAATAGGVVAAIGGIVKGVASNAEFERYQTQFGVLLGSTEKAKARLADLAEFGQKTPFELPEVVQADKILQGFGLHSEEAAKKFGFSGSQIRTIAGDVAAGTGSSFSEMSLLLGKFSAGATGEAISRMAELGIASRADLAKMGLEFDKSGALLSPLPKAMNVVLQLMQQKYGGMMDAQSQTFEGMISNLQDWVSGTLRTLSAPIFDVVKDKLGTLLAFLSAPDTQAMLQSFATSLANGVGVAMDFISNTVIPAFTQAWINLQPVFQFVISLIGQIISTVSGIVASFTSAGASAGGLRDTLIGIFGAELGNAIANFADWLSVRVPQAIAATQAFIINDLLPALSDTWKFIQANVLPVVASLVAWFLNNLPGAIDTVVAFINDPLIPTFTALWNFVSTYVIPVLQTIFNWLSINIPPAIQATSDFINNVLVPAFTAVWGFINDYVIPVITTLVTGTMAGLDAATNTTSGIWNTVLLPAITAVWNFINGTLIPLFNALNNVYLAAVNLALRALTAVWDNVLLPALQKVWDFLLRFITPVIYELYNKYIENGLKPAIASLGYILLGFVMPMFENMANILNSKFRTAMESAKVIIREVSEAFHWITNAIQDVISWIQKVADKLNSISIPDWLQGHSPPPMAHWFRYIGQAAQMVNDEFDTFNRQMMNGQLTMPITPGGIAGSATSLVQGGTQLNITANYDYQQERTIRDEIRMQAMLLGINPTG